MKQNFDAEGWFAALCRAVEARRATWQQVSKATGVSASTLSRMREGRRPDAASLAALSAWAGLNPAEFCPRVPPQRVTCEACQGRGWSLEPAADVRDFRVADSRGDRLQALVMEVADKLDAALRAPNERASRYLLQEAAELAQKFRPTPGGKHG